MGVFVLSEIEPKIGSSIRAARLSQAITIPTSHCTSRIASILPLSLSLAEFIPCNAWAKMSVRKVGHQES